MNLRDKKHMFKKIKVKCTNKHLANKKHFIKHCLTRLKGTEIK